VLSFGFKYGLPVDADIVLDARFLPNPHWVEALRERTGLDPAVNDYVIEQPDAPGFLDQASGLIDLMAAGYLREGKRYVTIAIGCTGGQHRSVYMVERLAQALTATLGKLQVRHRELHRPGPL